MNLNIERSGEKLDVSVKGKLDAISSPKFEEEVASSLEGIKELVINIGEVEYVSSAGLRALLYLYQTMSGQGSMAVRDVPPIVMDLFELTGFTDIVGM